MLSLSDCQDDPPLFPLGASELGDSVGCHVSTNTHDGDVTPDAHIDLAIPEQGCGDNEHTNGEHEFSTLESLHYFLLLQSHTPARMNTPNPAARNGVSLVLFKMNQSISTTPVANVLAQVMS